jgi:hypothetical protein
MDDVQHAIESLQTEIKNSSAVIDKAIRDRRTSAKDSPLVAEFNTAIATARQELAAVELKLRQLYESKSED